MVLKPKNVLFAAFYGVIYSSRHQNQIALIVADIRCLQQFYNEEEEDIYCQGNKEEYSFNINDFTNVLK